MRSSSANRYDAIVIGAGHNGLVAAAYLARKGARTVVLEARHKVGGASDTSAPWPEAPDIKVNTLSYTMSLMPPRIRRDLELERFGFRLLPLGQGYMPMRGGGSLIQSDDDEVTRASIGRLSKRDADAYFEFYVWIERIAAILGPMLMETPPDIGSRKLGGVWDVAKLGWKLRKHYDRRTIADVTRLFTMSATDLLDRWFETPQMKGFMAVNGIIGTWAGPDAPGTAYVLMHHSVGDVGDGEVAHWGFMEGGMGAVADAVRASAESRGAEVRVNAPVERVLVRGGRTFGVALEGGEEVYAPIVITACHPKITFLRQIDRSELPSEFVHDIEHWKTRSGTVKINLALSRLPTFTADPDFDPEIHGGAIEILDDVDQLEAAFQEARSGKAASAIFSDCEIPSVVDKTLAPEGIHVMSCFSQWVPASWADDPEDHTADLDAYADRLIGQLEEVAPGFRDSIVHRQIIGPKQMQEEFHLIGGNIFHGELSVDQLFHMRPAIGYADYRTPIRGLYQASSATHAGGGVTGLPGHHVVREIVKDRALKR
jgi:phytoene dehydrogenase-like protein